MTVLQGGRAAHKGQGWGIGSGEGPSVSNAPRHSVKIYNHHASQELDVEVPEDRSVSLQVASCEYGGIVCSLRHVCQLWAPIDDMFISLPHMHAYI